MATNPGAPEPDIIRPQAPPETPAPAGPAESPSPSTPEIAPDQPDFDQPDRSPSECPPGL